MDYPLYEVDTDGYATPHRHLFGRNPQGDKVHLMEPDPFNNISICGISVSGTSSGAFLAKHSDIGRSYLCKLCEKIADTNQSE